MSATQRPEAEPRVDYRAVFDSLPNPCALLTTDFSVIDVNEAFLTQVGGTRRGLLGRKLPEVLPPGPAEPDGNGITKVAESLQRALSSGQTDVLPIQRYDVPPSRRGPARRTRYWIPTTTPVKDASGRVVALLHKIQDVTSVVELGASTAQELERSSSEELSPSSSGIALAHELQNANALLHDAQERERKTSLTLQSAMLPASIPVAARTRVAARYLPAVSSLNVCGDWYDVAEMPDGRLALAVGDVVGQGLQAAAVMGQLRSALSAVTVADVGPGNALQILDRFARQMEEQATATTAVKAVLDFGRGTITYSSAGHLPPLLLHPDGRVQTLDEALGPPLDAAPEPGPRPQATASFHPGATLVLYTDGLVERRDEDLSDGIARLTRCLLDHPDLPPEELADTLVTEVRGTRNAPDDTALLVIRL